MSLLSICALLILPICVSSQSLVLAGGNLKDDNAIVYGKMVELAVKQWNTRLLFPSFEQRNYLQLFVGWSRC